MINKRLEDGAIIIDPSSLENLTYSNASGARKSAEVGRSLSPLGDGAGGFTTNATAIKILPALGKNIAVYNNSGTVASITLGESSLQVSLAAGVTDASGHVGIPCMPNSWTYIACNMSQYVIASSANLMVFVINDDTYIRPVSQNNAST